MKHRLILNPNCITLFHLLMQNVHLPLGSILLSGISGGGSRESSGAGPWLTAIAVRCSALSDPCPSGALGVFLSGLPGRVCGPARVSPSVSPGTTPAGGWPEPSTRRSHAEWRRLALLPCGIRRQCSLAPSVCLWRNSCYYEYDYDCSKIHTA